MNMIHYIKNISFISFVISILFSCASEKNILMKTDAYVMNIDSLSSKELKYSDIFKSVKTIILENDKVLIGKIDRMQSFQSNLFILDRDIAKGLYVFNKEGKFIRKIGNIGSAPGEYVSCDDFTINTFNNEALIYDSYQHKIYTYDISSGQYIGNVDIDKDIHFMRMTFNGEYLYTTNIFFTPGMDKEPFYLLSQIDLKTGKPINQWLKVEQYNKGWLDKLLQKNIFYNIGEDRNLFAYGLMDSIFCIEKGTIYPYVAIKSNGIVQEADISTEKAQLADPNARRKNMIPLLDKLMRNGKVLEISDIFEHNGIIHFNFTKRNGYTAQYNKKTDALSVFSRTKNNLLFKQIPNQYQVPLFLDADEEGVFYTVQTDYLPELKYFATDGYLSDDVIGRKEIESLDENSNPAILYYEYKD